MYQAALAMALRGVKIEAVTAERRGNVVRYRLSAGIAREVLSDICAAFDRLAA